MLIAALVVKTKNLCNFIESAIFQLFASFIGREPLPILSQNGLKRAKHVVVTLTIKVKKLSGGVVGG
ncbi:hypothetical protein BH09VER1_BH09VER1_47390 [soil metagenome]